MYKLFLFINIIWNYFRGYLKAYLVLKNIQEIYLFYWRLLRLSVKFLYKNFCLREAYFIQFQYTNSQYIRFMYTFMLLRKFLHQLLILHFDQTHTHTHILQIKEYMRIPSRLSQKDCINEWKKHVDIDENNSSKLFGANFCALICVCLICTSRRGDPWRVSPRFVGHVRMHRV